jgi:hypothetical protein
MTNIFDLYINYYNKYNDDIKYAVKGDSNNPEGSKKYNNLSIIINDIQTEYNKLSSDDKNIFDKYKDQVNSTMKSWAMVDDTSVFENPII